MRLLVSVVVYTFGTPVSCDIARGLCSYYRYHCFLIILGNVSDDSTQGVAMFETGIANCKCCSADVQRH